MEKVKLKFFDGQLEYTKSLFDSAGIALFLVNEHLKEKGVDIEFDYLLVEESEIVKPYIENCKEVSHE